MGMGILWGYPQDFLWVWDGYGDRNSVPTAALSRDERLNEGLLACTSVPLNMASKANALASITVTACKEPHRWGVQDPDPRGKGHF